MSDGKEGLDHCHSWHSVRDSVPQLDQRRGFGKVEPYLAASYRQALSDREGSQWERTGSRHHCDCHPLPARLVSLQCDGGVCEQAMGGLDRDQDSAVCDNRGGKDERLCGGRCRQDAGPGCRQWQSCCSPP